MDDNKAIAMFGCTEAEMKDGFEAMLEWFQPRQAMNVLSDAQELMAIGNIDQARQYINRVKWLLGGMPRPRSGVMYKDEQEWGIYDQNNAGIATVKAKSEGHALQEFARQHNVPDHQLDSFWAEEIDSFWTEEIDA